MPTRTAAKSASPDESRTRMEAAAMTLMAFFETPTTPFRIFQHYKIVHRNMYNFDEKWSFSG